MLHNELELVKGFQAMLEDILYLMTNLQMPEDMYTYLELKGKKELLETLATEVGVRTVATKTRAIIEMKP